MRSIFLQLTYNLNDHRVAERALRNAFFMRSSKYIVAFKQDWVTDTDLGEISNTVSLMPQFVFATQYNFPVDGIIKEAMFHISDNNELDFDKVRAWLVALARYLEENRVFSVIHTNDDHVYLRYSSSYDEEVWIGEGEYFADRYPYWAYATSVCPRMFYFSSNDGNKLRRYGYSETLLGREINNSDLVKNENGFVEMRQIPCGSAEGSDGWRVESSTIGDWHSYESANTVCYDHSSDVLQYANADISTTYRFATIANDSRDDDAPTAIFAGYGLEARVRELCEIGDRPCRGEQTNEPSRTDEFLESEMQGRFDRRYR